MADWTIEVDMMTKQMQDAFSRENVGGGTSNNTTQQENTIAGGFSKGLKFAGVIGILSSIKVVVESIGFLLSGLSALISYFVVSFIQNVVSFFQDPVRSLLELGIWIVNGFIKGLNLVISAINALIPGTGSDIGLLPEFDTQEVLRLYDEAKAALKEAVTGVNESAQDLNIIPQAIEGLKVKADRMVNTIGDAFDYIDDQVKKMTGGGVSGFSSGTSSGSLFQSGGNTGSNILNMLSKSSRDPEVEARRLNANKTLKYGGGIF